MNTLNSYLIFENNSGSKGLEYYFGAPSISHLKNFLGGDNKRPMERKQGKQYIIYKWSHAKNWKPKGYEESKILRKQCVSKQSTKSYEYKIAEISSPSVSWKSHTSLTQKDTMDRGAYWKIQKERHEEDSEGPKSPQAHKSAKWHGNEEQMNIYVYHMLRSYGAQAGSYPKTEEKMKLIFLASKELSWLWNLGFHFPKVTTLNV